MILYCGLLLMFVSFVRTVEPIYDFGMDSAVTEFEQYSYWPSFHNALVRLHKREVEPVLAGMSEGGGTVAVGDIQNKLNNPSSTNPVDNNSLNNQNNQPITPPPVIQPTAADVKQQNGPQKQTKAEANNEVDAAGKHTAVVNETNTTLNATVPTAAGKQLDLYNPGVLMRGVIVFGGFLLLAVAYYIFYKKKSSDSEMGNNHNANDANQFRYGVLQSDDRRDNLELSRVPLTMESDDDDEDLEIFDLEQKKKSLSYVNLQTNDEDIVFPNSNESTDKDNLLLDIEDASTDTLINWSTSGNKSIL